MGGGLKWLVLAVPASGLEAGLLRLSSVTETSRIITKNVILLYNLKIIALLFPFIIVLDQLRPFLSILKLTKMASTKARINPITPLGVFGFAHKD